MLYCSANLCSGVTTEAFSRVKNVGLGDLLERCHFLYVQAFDANNEMSILCELQNTPTKYEKDVTCAPCYLGYSKLCLTESCFMNCARLYDSTGDLSLEKLLKSVYGLASTIDENIRAPHEREMDFNTDKPIRHSLSSDEERFYQNRVDAQRGLENLAAEMGSYKPEVNRPPAVIDMATRELHGLWTKRLKGLNKIVKRLRKQRNKAYAHCGIESLNYDELADRFPIKFSEMQQLIDFALDVTIELAAIITGEWRPRRARNVNDINGLFQYVNLGMLALDGECEAL